MAYHRLEPFGQDYMHLMLAQILLGIGHLKQGTKLTDLVPGEKPSAGVIDQADLRTRLDATMAMIGAVRRN